MAADPEAPAPRDDPIAPYHRPSADLIAALGSDARRGLSFREAAARLERHGRNELPTAAPVTAWRRSEDRSAFHALGANRWLWLAICVSIGLQLAVVHAPFLQRAFRTVPLAPGDWLLCTAVASSVLWAAELKKLLHRRRIAAATPPRARLEA